MQINPRLYLAIFKTLVNNVTWRTACQKLTWLCVAPFQRWGVGVVSAGPRRDLRQFNVAAAPTHDLRRQDVGSGAADEGVIDRNDRYRLTYTHNKQHKMAASRCSGSSLKPPHCGVRPNQRSLSRNRLLSLVSAKFYQISLLLYRCLFSTDPFCHCWTLRSSLSLFLSLSLPPSLSFLPQISTVALTNCLIYRRCRFVDDL